MNNQFDSANGVSSANDPAKSIETNQQSSFDKPGHVDVTKKQDEKQLSKQNNNIFQQYIASPSQYGKEQMAFHSLADSSRNQGTYQSKPSLTTFDKFQSSPGSHKVHVVQNQASQVNPRYDMNKNLQQFGKQAMSGADKNMVKHIKHQSYSGNQAPEQKEAFASLPIKGDTATSADHKFQVKSKHFGKNKSTTTNRLAIKPKQEQDKSSSFEESRDIFYGHGGIHQTLGNSNSGKDQQNLKAFNNDQKIDQKNNNLNQNLLPLQPQTTKRGQRRHFQFGQDVEQILNTKVPEFQNAAQAQMVGHPQKTSNQNSQRDQPAEAGNLAQNRIRRNVPYAYVFEQEQPAADGQTRKTFEQSIFQKNRNKQLQVGLQHQIQKPDQTFEQIDKADADQSRYQFKSVFPSSNQDKNNLSQYGQNTLAKQLVNQAMSQAVKEDKIKQTPPLRPRISSFKVKTNEQVNKSNNSNSDIQNQSQLTAKEILFSPQPKTSSQMSQYDQQNKRSRQASQQREAERDRDLKQNSSNKKRHLSIINNTDEKQKRGIQGELRTHTNFRKYKKRELVDNGDADLNVLGQPKTQYGNEDFQRNTILNHVHVVGTGIFSNRNATQNSFKQQIQTSINLPSMMQSDISTNAANNIGGPQSSSNGLNITSMGSQLQSSVKTQDQTAAKASQPFIRKNRKHQQKDSVFSISDFSSNIVDNGANNTQKQAIAWEIQFKKNDQPKTESDQDFVQAAQQQQAVAPALGVGYSELQKLMQTDNKSPGVNAKGQKKQIFKLNQGKGQSFQPDRSQMSTISQISGGALNLNNTTQYISNEGRAEKQKKLKVKLLKIPQKITEVNKAMSIVGNLSAQKQNDENRKTQSRDFMNVFIQNSGSFEGAQFPTQNAHTTNGSGTIAVGNTTNQFRRQAPIKYQATQGSGSKNNSNQINQRRILKQKEAGPVKTKHQKQQNSQTKDESFGPHSSTFKNGRRHINAQFKQTHGELPAELIVTSYSKQVGDTQEKLLFENQDHSFNMYPIRTPEKQIISKDVSFDRDLSQLNDSIQPDDLNGSLVDKKKPFDYEMQEKEQEFFDNTSGQYFDEYMNQHVELSEDEVQESKGFEDIQQSEVNPSANPSSSVCSRKSDQPPEQRHLKHRQIVVKHELKKIHHRKESDSESEVVIERNKQPVHKYSSKELEFNIQQKSYEDLSMDQSVIINEKSKLIQSAVNKQRIESLNNNRWSGGISVQTQMKFQKIINENIQIKEKLSKLKYVGINNESNSLFKQIVEDIQKAKRNSLTYSEIVNCIKASSFGSCFDQQTKVLNVPLAKPKLQNTNNKQNSGGQSRGYSQYQSQFNYEITNNSQKQGKVFKKSQSLITIKRQFADKQNFFNRGVADQLSRQSLNLPLIHSYSLKQEYKSENNIFGLGNKVGWKQNYANDDYLKTPMSININKIKKGLTYLNTKQSGSQSMRASNQLRLKKSFQGINQNRFNNFQNRINDQTNQSLRIHGFSHREIKSEKNMLISRRQECWADQPQHGQSPLMGQAEKGQKYINVQLSNRAPLISVGITPGEQQSKVGSDPQKRNHVRFLDNKQLSQYESPQDNSKYKTELQSQNSIQQRPDNALLCVPGIPVKRNLQNIDSEIQMERAIRPGEPGNPGIPSQTSTAVQEMHKKNTQKKKQIAYLNQQSNQSRPSLVSSDAPNIINKDLPKQSYQSEGNIKSDNNNTAVKSKNSDKNSSYTAKYSKQKISFLNQPNRVGLYQPNDNRPQVQKIVRQEPVEYGQIIKWRQGEIVGLGSSSVVYQAIRVDTNKTFAVKKFKVVSDITGIDQNKLKIIKNEIQKYKQLEHKNIIKFYGCELLDQFFCIYLEQMQSSLANILSDYGYFDEKIIRFYSKQILEGLTYLHDKKIKHLDLKCSNILTDNDMCIKLCDFGSAREFKKGSSNGSSSFTSLQSQILGSVQWMAPEVITEKGTGSKSDIWSLGCTIVEMFVGGNPWGEKIDDQNLFQAQQVITNSELVPSIPKSKNVSKNCQDFLNQCFTREYNLRPSSFELLKHPWILEENILEEQRDTIDQRF